MVNRIIPKGGVILHTPDNMNPEARQMKKRILAILTILAIFLSLMPQAALAATYTVADGEVLNIESGVLTHVDSTTETLSIADGDTISVDAGATATITGSKNVMIDCGAGTALTLDGVTIDVSATDNACALSFTGIGNTLMLSGASSLKSGANEPGVRVEGTDVLEIAGDGSLRTTGGDYGAGIGGGYDTNAGIINISGGTITAKGGRESAGIGGGDSGDGGHITISGGSVDATGGGGSGGGAGIGGGDGEYGNTITINGNAQVTATGGLYAAGIGGGGGSGGGTITISGGAVYARRGHESADDIGGGFDGHSGALEISGSAAVFMRNDAHCALTTSHSRLEATKDSVIDDKFYGVLMQDTWYSPCWAYMKLYTLDYDSGISGDAAPSSVTQAVNTKTSVADGSGMKYTGYAFAGWNAAEDGSSTDYAPGDEFTYTGDATLYAQWETGYTLDYDKNEGFGTAPLSVVDQLTGTSITVESGEGLTREGYVFDSWNTVKDGSGTPYAPDDTLTLKEDTTLYAQWETAYTLDYDKNEGIGTAPLSVVDQLTGTSITVESGDGLTREGYVFDSWNTVKNGSGKSYAPGDTLTLTEDTTLYAQWKKQDGQKGSIIVALEEDSGNPIAGYTVELHSTVKTAVTDANGKVTFSDVLFEDHTLIVKDSGGNTRATIDLNMDMGTLKGYSVDESIVDVTYTKNTVSVQIDITLDGEDVTVTDVIITENPDTGDSGAWLWILFLGLCVVFIALGVRKFVANR